MTEYNFSQLPPELLIQIFGFLSFYDIQAVRQTCKYWNGITKLPELNAKGVMKMFSCTLDQQHPAVEVMHNQHTERIFLYNVKYDSDETLFQNMDASLREVSLQRLRDVSFLPILKYLPHIHTLRLIHLRPSSIALHGIEHIRLGHLKTLELKENVPGFDEIFLKLALKSLALERLMIERCVAEKEVLDLLEAQPSISSLFVGYYHPKPLHTTRWMQAVSRLTIKDLTLRGNFRDILLTHVILNQKALRCLDLAGCGEMCNEHAQILGDELMGLEKLSLAFCSRITFEGLVHLSKLGRLKILDITYLHTISALPDMNSSLEELLLTNSQLSEDMVLCLPKRLPNLRVLDLSECHKAVTNKAIQRIFECLGDLRELALKNCTYIDDDGMFDSESGVSIQCLKKLQRLNLSGCKPLTDRTLGHALKLPDLRFLDITYCDGMTDEGIQGLVQNCRLLEEMHISLGKRVTAQAVEMVTGQMNRLRKLMVFRYEDVDVIPLPCYWSHIKPSEDLEALTYRKLPTVS